MLPDFVQLPWVSVGFVPLINGRYFELIESVDSCIIDFKELNVNLIFVGSVYLPVYIGNIEFTNLNPIKNLEKNVWICDYESFRFIR